MIVNNPYGGSTERMLEANTSGYKKSLFGRKNNVMTRNSDKMFATAQYHLSSSRESLDPNPFELNA